MTLRMESQKRMRMLIEVGELIILSEPVESWEDSPSRLYLERNQKAVREGVQYHTGVRVRDRVPEVSCIFSQINFL